MCGVETRTPQLPFVLVSSSHAWEAASEESLVNLNHEVL